MPDNEVIDPTCLRQRHTQQKLRRVLLPVLGVSLVIASMAAIGIHTYRIVDAGSLRLSRDLLVATQKEVAQE